MKKISLLIIYLVIFTPWLAMGELTLSQSNGFSNSVYRAGISGYNTVGFIADDSVETLRGQTFVARTPSNDAGWNMTQIILRIPFAATDPVMGPDDEWQITVVEWQPNTDGNDVTAWLNGTPADALAGFTSPKIIVQDSGAFASETTLNRAALIFTLDPATEYFVETGKVYAVYFKYQNSDDEGFPVGTGPGSDTSEAGVMIFQNVGMTPDSVSDQDLQVDIHGVATTPTGVDLAPRFTIGANIEVPKNSSAYSAIQVTDFNAFNAGQSLVSYTVTNDNNALFGSQPVIDNDGILTFAPATGVFGVATVSVYATDDGVSNNQSVTKIFTITVTDREVMTLRVNANTPAAPGAQDGASWATAFADLQDALASSVAQDEIWVATGVYYPDEAAAGVASVTEDHTASSFQLVAGVSVYGGFAGNEMERSSRNLEANMTILSGDIDNETNPDLASSILGSNAMTVVKGVSDGSAVLDGFVITAGNDTSFSAGGLSGGAIVRNCTFRRNQGIRAGAVDVFEQEQLVFINCDFFGNSGRGVGVIECYDTDLTMTSCRIQGNESTGSTGGPPVGAISVSQGNSLLTNCLITGNRGGKTGAVGFFSFRLGDELVLNNCTIAGNEAYGEGRDFYEEVGGVGTSDGAPLTINNSIIWGNSSPTGVEVIGLSSASLSANLISGLNPGGNNLDGTLSLNDPRFVRPLVLSGAATISGDFRLTGDSPVIGTGDVALSSITQDIAGNPRVIDNLDMGAYEYTGPSSPLGSLTDFRAYYGLAADGSDDASDWSGNGVANIFYLAFGFNAPNDVDIDRSRLPTVTLGDDDVTFSYLLASPLDGLQATLLTSTDLSNWVNPADLSMDEQPTSVTNSDADPGYVRYTITMPQVAARRFFSLGVTAE